MPFQGGRNLICSQKKYKVPPNLMVLSVGAEIEIKVGRNMKSRWKEIRNQVETNPSQRFPKFDGLSKSPSNFEDVFRHFVMNLSVFFGSTSISVYMGGLINHFLQVWCPTSHSIWPLLFLHRPTGGCGTRLSVRRQDQHNYSDTETRCLVYYST